MVKRIEIERENWSTQRKEELSVVEKEGMMVRMKKKEVEEQRKENDQKIGAFYKEREVASKEKALFQKQKFEFYLQQQAWSKEKGNFFKNYKVAVFAAVLFAFLNVLFILFLYFR